MHREEHLITTLCKDKIRPMVMGILNVTPDSFSDGNQHLTLSKAVDYTRTMILQGADMIDVGGESTRPGAAQVNPEKEIDRVIPVINAIRGFSAIPLSVDTRKADVAEQAIKAGANIINDVSALRHDADMIKVLQDNKDILIILMHMLGEPASMQINPEYDNVIYEINSFFRERIDYCVKNNIAKDRILIDPGIGFGKKLEHNAIILANLKSFKEHGCPIVLGASRKRFINEIDLSEPLERLGGSLSTTMLAMQSGVDVIRVHDVKEHLQFMKVLNFIQLKKIV